ncbi:MAG: hypothetical protein ACE5JE_02800 [Thermoplasmata archaeon]
MRSLEDIFGDTLFLGATRGLKRDEERLWMIAEHLEEDETALAFLSLRTGNLLLTPKRVLELKPHLDVGGMWNVLRFEGYAVTAEEELRYIQRVHVEASRGGGRLGLETRSGEREWSVPAASSSKDPSSNARAFADRILERL